jgi:hypothetical protein
MTFPHNYPEPTFTPPFLSTFPTHTHIISKIPTSTYTHAPTPKSISQSSSRFPPPLQALHPADLPQISLLSRIMTHADPNSGGHPKTNTRDYCESIQYVECATGPVPVNAKNPYETREFEISANVCFLQFPRRYRYWDIQIGTFRKRILPQDKSSSAQAPTHSGTRDQKPRTPRIPSQKNAAQGGPALRTRFW